MVSEHSDFEWEVRSAGYEWRDAKALADGATSRYLVERVPAGGRSEARRYGVLQDHPALYRTFAGLELAEEALRAFADEYGPLGDPVAVELARGPGEPPRHGIAGERYKFWIDSIHFIRQGVLVWDALRYGGDHRKLEEHIRWEKGENDQDVVVYDSRPDLKPGPRPNLLDQANPFQWLISYEAVPGVGPMSLRPPDVWQPAWLFLRQLVTRHLNQSDRVFVAMTRPPNSPAVLRVLPRNLLGCLWLQLAEAISQNKKERPCAGCGRWFVIQGRSRLDKQFCNAACRTRAYRERQEQAARMKAEGKTYKQIADELGSDAETVKGWVAASKRKGK